MSSLVNVVVEWIEEAGDLFQTSGWHALVQLVAASRSAATGLARMGGQLMRRRE
jgi:hypothetical protein